jgi:1-acyl-sn-glycerol-3-phosphate acyltransferase
VTEQHAVGSASHRMYEFVRLIARIAVPLLAKLRTEGLENIPSEGPVILAMNHIAWLDIPLASMRVPRVTHYMAKIELFSVPVLGWVMRRCGAYPVRRGESDREALRTSERLLTQGEVLVVFPEGHRTRGKGLLPGHPGVAFIALRAGVPIIPVAIWGTEHIFKSGFGPWAPQVTVRYGRPFRLDVASAGRRRDALGRAADQIMREVAALLPPEYRGAYADLDTDAPVAGATPAEAEEPSASRDPRRA